MMVQAPEPDLHHGVLERINAGFCVIQVLFEGDRAVDYRFLEVNDAFERHTGLKDARGQRMTELEPNHEQDWFRIYGEVARSGRPAQFEMEARALGRSFAVDAVRVGRPGEDKVGILFFDITARKQMEVELGRCGCSTSAAMPVSSTAPSASSSVATRRVCRKMSGAAWCIRTMRRYSNTNCRKR